MSVDLPPRRSATALKTVRRPLPWPEEREFRILSIDGGGIRGLFAARFLEVLEERYTGGRSVADYFDMIAGTSTGGILALGFGAGMTAGDLRRLYVRKGRQVFPYYDPAWANRVARTARWLWRLVKPGYSRPHLEGLLEGTFGSRLLGSATTRLCVPASEGRYGEPVIFKTPHHPDYRLDATKTMTVVGLATGAAPTYYRAVLHRGYRLVDGGLFVNDPIMVGLTDALSCFAVSRRKMRILSIGSTASQQMVGRWRSAGGMLAWATAIDVLLRLQSLNAQGQASLLIGRDRIVRIQPPEALNKIALDDWKGSVHDLIPAADDGAATEGAEVAGKFLDRRALPYRPAIEKWKERVDRKGYKS